MPSERVFSTAGDIVIAQRSALNAENVDKLMFLKKNLKAYGYVRLCAACHVCLLTCLKFIQMRCVLIYLQHRKNIVIRIV